MIFLRFFGRSKSRPKKSDRGFLGSRFRPPTIAAVVAVVAAGAAVVAVVAAGVAVIAVVAAARPCLPWWPWAWP